MEQKPEFLKFISEFKSTKVDNRPDNFEDDTFLHYYIRMKSKEFKVFGTFYSMGCRLLEKYNHQTKIWEPYHSFDLFYSKKLSSLAENVREANYVYANRVHKNYIRPAKPEITQVLQSLQFDCRIYRECETFKGFCQEFGNEPEAWKSLETWQSMEKIYNSLKEFFGYQRFEEFMNFDFEGEQNENL